MGSYGSGSGSCGLSGTLEEELGGQSVSVQVHVHAHSSMSSKNANANAKALEAAAVLPLLAEEDLLQDAHLSVPLGHLLGAVGSGADQAAGQRQGPGRRPRDPLLHGVVGEPPRHLKRLPVHHQLPLGRLAKVLDLVDVDWWGLGGRGEDGQGF